MVGKEAEDVVVVVDVRESVLARGRFVGVGGGGG